MAIEDFSDLLRAAPNLPDGSSPEPKQKPAAPTATTAASAAVPPTKAAPSGDFADLLSAAPDVKASASSDDLFDRLIMQESRGQQFDRSGAPLTSKKGAIGIAQVMPGTAPEAAALAGVPFDDMRYRTDAEYNKTLGRAYFNKQLADFGDPAKALAAYNAGPGAMRAAMVAAEKAGNPGGWLNYLPAETRAYVPAILARISTGSRAPQGNYSNTQAAPVQQRSTMDAIKDNAIGLGAGVVQGVGMLASAFGADNAVARGADGVAQDLIDMQSPQRKAERVKRAEIVREAESSGSTWEEIKANLGAFADAPLETTLNALGTSAPTLLMSLIPGLGQANAARLILQGAAGAAQGAGAVKQGIYEAVERKLVETGMSKDDAAKVAAGAQAYDSENGGQIALGALLGVAAGTTGAEKVVSSIAGKTGGTALKTLPGKVAKGVVSESLPEAAQGGQERLASNIALQNQGFDVPTWQGVAGQAAGEAVASALPGGVFGAIEPTRPPESDKKPVDPTMAAVEQTAAQPNSPLSKAAVAGTAAAPESAPQPAPVDPLARLAELESIGKGTPDETFIDPEGNEVTIPGTKGRFFTKEEKDEYDALKALRDSTPGQEQDKGPDQILARARSIEQLLRTNNGLQALRGEDSPVSVQTFLADLAKAKSASTPAAVREQALARLETTAEWLGFDLSQIGAKAAPKAEAAAPSTPAGEVMAATSSLSPEDRSTVLAEMAAYRNPSLPQATRDASLARALEIVGRQKAATMPSQANDNQAAVLGDIPPAANTPEYFLREADRRESGAYQFMELGFTEEADALRAEADSLREKAASARAGELDMEASADVASPEEQQNVEPSTPMTVDEATADLPRAAIPPVAGDPTAPDNTAIRRKRRAQFDQLAGIGFDTVERRDNGFVMRNSKDGKEIVIDSPAEAQLARMAIKKRVDDVAHTAAASPLDLNGVKVKIENPAGSVRRGVGPDGTPWETKMVHHYGEIQGTEGADGDKVDVFIGNRPDSSRVWAIDQVNEDGSFDEHKLVFGATSEEDARQTYLANYEKGWTGLGSITEIPAGELKNWLRNNAKKPAAESELGRFTVQSDGKVYTINSVPVDSLPEAASAARGEKGRRITKQQALLLKGLAAFFGKDIVFFSDPKNEINSDGFVKPGDDVTIYINESSGVSPLAVFGHELMHILKRDNPAAYAAIAKVVRARVADAKGFRADYNGKKVDEVADGDLNENELEELISDLNGNLMGDQKFWGEVFAQIQEDNGQKASGIIAQLAAFMQRILDAAAAHFKGKKGFRADGFVKELDAVREAFRKGLAQYAQSTGVTKTALQASILRADKAQGPVQRSVARKPDDGLTVEGYHFSDKPRETLSTGFFGSGLKGSDREEIQNYPDPRIRERLSFYVNKGTGVRPEAGVGGIAHKATLTNIYDADADMKRLKQGRNKRGFEMAVLNSGYSGYLTRMEGTQPGQVILLGQQTVTPEVLGLRTAIDDAAQVPAPKQRPMDLGDKILAEKSLPAGRMAPARWAEELMRAMPQEAAQLMDIGALKGDQPMYRDELVALARKLGGEIRASKKRTQDEYAEVEAKYKGTDQWLKAPNGEPTNLSERQWVQVRTPSFKQWFGDWEQAYKEGGVWSAKPGSVSLAVSANGEPLVVYHGSDNAGFMSFNKPGGEKRGDLGIWTTSNESMAYSYVRRGRVGAVEAAALPQSREDLESLGYSFDSYEGVTSSRQTEPQPLFSYMAPDGYEVTGFESMDAAVADAIAEHDGEDTYERKPGVYSLFINIRNPNESHFEGAVWNGERPGQYVALGEDGEQLSDVDGTTYFDTFVEANAVAEANGGTVEPAPDHYETTDSVVREAIRYNNDGAIIQQVIDDGGGLGYDGEPSDVYVAFDPSQVKSADFNNGEFDTSSSDIRRSAKRQRDPALGDKTDVSQLPNGREIPSSAAVGGLENSLALARSKSYRRGRELKEDIQNRVLAASKAARVNLADRTKNTFKFLSGMVMADAKYALKSNENAVGWYDQKVSRAIGALSTIHPEIDNDPRSRLAFLWALATTSNGLKVDKNFELAEKAYREWKATVQMPTKIGIGNAAQAINKGMAAYNALVAKVGDERLLKFMSTKFEVGQIQRMLGMKVGGEWMPTPVRGAAILGPKIGNGFFSNLNGYFDALTMDRWLMRTWGRLTGTLLNVSKKDIDKSRTKLASRVAALSDEERKTLSKVVGVSIKKKMTRAQLDALAKASQKASMKKEKREIMMAAEATNEFRKAANLHHMTMDGQKEAPEGPGERNWIRAVFQDALDKLNADGVEMTMSDLQALLWYPERRLYDAAKSDEDVADGYEDDEAPDYANAAYDLAIASGVDKTRVLAAMDAAEARGTVKGKQLTDAERQAMLDEFKSPPEQMMQLLYEVAPDPDNVELTQAWNKLPMKDREQITALVRDALLADVVNAVGVKVGKTVSAMGGFENQANPNLISAYKPKEVSYEQARLLAAAIGMALDQKSVVIADPRGSQTHGLVRITLNGKSAKVAPALMKAVGDATGAYDFTSRGNNIDVLNFTGLSTESLADKIEEAVGEFDEELEFQISYGEVKSELIEKDQYESEIKAARPGSWREILERVRRSRDRAREIVEAELRGRAVDVPGSAGSARRDDAGAQPEAGPAAAADDVAVREQGGLRRSARRLAAEGGSDQGTGREEDGSLKGLPRDFTIAGEQIRASAWAPAEAVARRYMEQAGLEYNPPTTYAKVDRERAQRIAAEYDKLKHDPSNPEVKAAYEALAAELIGQYRAVVDSGLKVEFIDYATQGDPYEASPRLMTEDVRENNHMWVFSTRDGFGSDQAFDPAENPLLAETEFEISGQKALLNDLFRVVHDYFGHVKEGVGFRADGEENTWRAHSAMFSPLAQRALTTETRGQNSWVNFGPYGEVNRGATAGETRYADQKTGLLPLWVSEEGRYDATPEKTPGGKSAVSDDNIVIEFGDASTQPETMLDTIEPAKAKGRKVTYEVEVEDTGETASMTVDAGQALEDYDDRIDTMKKLLECLRK